MVRIITRASSARCRYRGFPVDCDHSNSLLILVLGEVSAVAQLKRWGGGVWTGRIGRVRQTFWKTLPNSSLLIFLAAVFCLFGSLGFILDSRNPQETTVSELIINVTLRSCLAVCWAFSTPSRTTHLRRMVCTRMVCRTRTENAVSHV